MKLLALAMSASLVAGAPVWHSSDRYAEHKLAGGYVALNNVWGCGPCGPQSIWARSARHWGVTSKQPTGYTYILSYPDVAKTLPGKGIPLSKLRTVRSRYAETFPHIKGVDAEAAYDVRINGVQGAEMMAYVDTFHQEGARYPAGHVTVYGVRWDLTVTPRSNDSAPEYVFMRHRNARRGVVHILALLRILQRQHRLPSNPRLTEVDFGWEIASTGGKSLAFTVSHYKLKIRSKK